MKSPKLDKIEFDFAPHPKYLTGDEAVEGLRGEDEDLEEKVRPFFRRHIS